MHTVPAAESFECELWWFGRSIECSKILQALQFSQASNDTSMLRKALTIKIVRYRAHENSGPPSA